MFNMQRVTRRLSNRPLSTSTSNLSFKCFSPSLLYIQSSRRSFHTSRPFQHGGHSHGPPENLSQDHAAKAKRITLIGVGANLGLCVSKMVVGKAAGSASLIADAVHSLSDLISDAVALVTLKLASLPPDAQHPYGYGHFETLGTLGVASLLSLAAFDMGISASQQLLALADISLPSLPIGGHGHHGHAIQSLSLELAPLALGAAAVSVVVKEALFRVTVKIGEEARSSVVIANAWHHRSDALSSLVAIVGISGAMVGLPALDSLGALAVSGLIAKTGVEIGWNAVKDLTDRQTNDRVLEGVKTIGQELIEDAESSIVSVHRIRCRQIGSYCLVELNVVVDKSLTIGQGHDQAKLVRSHVMDHFQEVHDVRVHVCPSDDADMH